MPVHSRLKISAFIIFALLIIDAHCQPQFSDSIITGAEQTEVYFPLLKGKNVALIANQSSLIKQTHLVDTLLHSHINIVKIFCPEHGFRGVADAGKTIGNTKDAKTGLPIISLYGKHKKPTVPDLQNIDIVVFDIQDVGVRFYTYISTLHFVMEACAENHLPLVVLDRPNPNGFYVDGPVLDTAVKSFVGMHPVPIVHGMTIGEYALMINGQKWLTNKIQCDISVITCKNYNHKTLYKLPVKPSPNLPNIKSVLLYPSLGLFEGTVVSVGRGTNSPFQIFGHPQYKKADFKFTPTSTQGATNPKYKGELCKGVDLRSLGLEKLISKKQIDLQYLIDAYSTLHKKTTFFNNYFYKLAGEKTLQQQITNGLPQEQIRASWQTKITNFKKIRKQYLLYPDFE